MKVIKEYSLNINRLRPQILYLPINSTPVGVYLVEDSLKLLVVENADEVATCLRTFKVCTSNERLYTNNLKYISNVITSEGVRHVVELI